MIDHAVRIAVALAASAAIVSCTPSPKTTQPAALPVHAAAVRDGALRSNLDLSGSIVAANAVNVGAVSAGRIVAMNVRVGDRVRAGDVLAQVDAAGYRAQYAQAQSGAQAASAQANAAGAQVTASQSQLHLAEVTASRMSTLFAQGAISRQDYDQSQAALQSARAGMQQAVAGADAARSAAQAASAGATAAGVPLSDAVIRAPFDGVVTARMLDVGAVVGPGAPVVALEDDRSLELDVALPNDASASVHAGDVVPVHVDALGNAALRGRIRAIAPSENPALRSSMLRIAVEADPRLSPGMYARVSIARRTFGLSVPAGALVTRAGQSGVFVVEKSSARFVPVDAGNADGGYVVVSGKDLKGARVIVSDLEALTDGSPVSVQ
jgi:multidrug efflux pump subunit AcrA (membrane-fusion protein)